jgi:hypothetical protein
MSTRWISCISVFAGLAILATGCSKGPAQDPSGQASTNPPIAIEPNVSVGKVRAGMTLDQVVAELGEPKRRTANALEYTTLGFAIIPSPDKKVKAVMCGDITGSRGPLARAFNGRTKEGIGMSSTRAEVIKAYGEPTETQNLGGGTVALTYAPLGITFTLDGDRVHHIIVRFTGPSEPDRTVTLEPAPTEKK